MQHPSSLVLQLSSRDKALGLMPTESAIFFAYSLSHGGPVSGIVDQKSAACIVGFVYSFLTSISECESYEMYQQLAHI